MVSFITAPISAPAAGKCPPRTFSATSGIAAQTFSIAASSAPSSLTTLNPRAAITAAGLPSPLITPSTTWRANLSVSSPLFINSTISATSFGVIESSSTATSFSFAIREISPSHQPRALVGSAPRFTVASTVPSKSALIIAAISLSGTDQASCKRFRCADGFSGNDLRSVSTQSALGATGTKSGSWK